MKKQMPLCLKNNAEPTKASQSPGEIILNRTEVRNAV